MNHTEKAKELTGLARYIAQLQKNKKIETIADGTRVTNVNGLPLEVEFREPVSALKIEEKQNLLRKQLNENVVILEGLNKDLTRFRLFNDETVLLGYEGYYRNISSYDAYDNPVFQWDGESIYQLAIKYIKLALSEEFFYETFNTQLVALQSHRLNLDECRKKKLKQKTFCTNPMLNYVIDKQGRMLLFRINDGVYLTPNREETERLIRAQTSDFYESTTIKTMYYRFRPSWFENKQEMEMMLTNMLKEVEELALHES